MVLFVVCYFFVGGQTVFELVRSFVDKFSSVLSVSRFPIWGWDVAPSLVIFQCVKPKHSCCRK